MKRDRIEKARELIEQAVEKAKDDFCDNGMACAMTGIALIILDEAEEKLELEETVMRREKDRKEAFIKILADDPDALKSGHVKKGKVK